MARPSGPKVRCSGNWTEARFNQFIMSLLRQGTRRWAPKTNALKKARTRRGFYMCASCEEEVPATLKGSKGRVKNAIVDHIKPIIDPEVGFTGWDDTINSMFCEEDNLQVLCNSCHAVKTKQEREASKERRRKERSV